VTLNRRALLVAASGLAAWPAFAQKTEDKNTDTKLPALTAYERETAGRIGVYAENISTGAKIAWRAEERFVMCSTFKASLAAVALARVDRGEDHLEQMVAYGPQDLLEYAPTARQNLAMGAMSVAEMCEAAVELSDNTCANLLLARVGGPSALTAFWRSTGDSVTRLEHHEPERRRAIRTTPPHRRRWLAICNDLRSVKSCRSHRGSGLPTGC
jgi:beta-lactamase class A